MKPKYYVTQSSAMAQSYKWAVADVLAVKNIFGTMNPNYNKL